MKQEDVQNMQQCTTQGGKNPPAKETICWAPCLAKQSTISLIELWDQEKNQPKLLARSKIWQRHIWDFQGPLCNLDTHEITIFFFDR